MARNTYGQGTTVSHAMADAVAQAEGHVVRANGIVIAPQQPPVPVDKLRSSPENTLVVPPECGRRWPRCVTGGDPSIIWNVAIAAAALGSF